MTGEWGGEIKVHVQERLPTLRMFLRIEGGLQGIDGDLGLAQGKSRGFEGDSRRKLREQEGNSSTSLGASRT